ncbi:MAG: hydroxypyruvate isomerase family protein [Cyclobacteriaceae bacterium]
MNRKQALKTLTAGAAALTFGGNIMSCNKNTDMKNSSLNGNIRHSVSRWCYGKYPLDQLADACKEMGIESIELLNVDECKTVIDKGLTCAMVNGSPLGISNGFNEPGLHGQLLQDYERLIPQVAELGLTNIICFSGDRKGMDDKVGMENCAKGLMPVVELAEKHNVIVIMELLNSKVNHPDYMCDNSIWGVELCEKIGSDQFKLLYDIYHMQIMEGDIIATIKKNHRYYGHYHTGGVPGRNEIDENQELYYPAIMKAIVETGYKGFVGQEFIPTWDDPLEALKQGIMICDV